MNNGIAGLPLLMAPATQGAAAEGAAGGQLVMTFVTFGLVFLIFWLLIIRPQNKKQKETKAMLDALKKGDRIVTIGGIRGTIHSIKEDSVIVRVDDTTKMEFSRSAISSVLERKGGKGGREEASQEAASDAEKADEKENQ